MKKYIRKILLLSLILFGLGNYQVEAISYQETYRVGRSQGANIRDEKGAYLGYLKKGHIVDGLLKKDYLEIYMDGGYAYVHMNYLDRLDKWPGFYISLGANARDMNNRKIGYMMEDALLSGVEDQGYVYLTKDGNFIKLHKNFLRKRNFGQPEEYISLGASMVGENGKELFYLEEGTVLLGSIEDKDPITVKYQGVFGQVKADRLILNRKENTYLSLGANIRDSEGNLVFRLDKGETIKARRSLGRIYFSHQGEKVSGHPKYLRKINR